MGFTFDILKDRDGSEYAQITGYEGSMTTLVIPPEAGGLPVRSIAGHAFAGRKDLKKVRIPETVRTIRSFAFYGCLNLLEIAMHDTTQDLYDGIIRQCYALRRIEIRGSGDNFIAVRELLRDSDNELRFRILLPDREIRLTFPEYVNEAREDTMARAIHFTIEGAGMAYRECVSKKAVNFAEYDRLLPRLTDYDFNAAVNIALDRLRFPEKLLPAAETFYRDFITGNAGRVLLFLTEEERSEDIRYVCREDLVPEEAVGTALERASDGGKTEICGILMEYVHKVQQGARSAAVLSLDDWD